MGAPKIFLSFAAEDGAWKDNFVNRRWFGDILGAAEIFDYQKGDALAFGQMNEWLANKVRTADVFIAFVSESYVHKGLTLHEWQVALEAHREELLFVPILLDGAAKQWWIDLKEKRKLRDLGDDFAYSDFTDGSGKPSPIVTDVGTVDRITRRIGELARLIKEKLRPQLPPPPPPPPSQRTVIVLGHPTAMFDREVVERVSSMREKLTELGRPIQSWNDQWRTNHAARLSSASFSAKNAIFIQPAGPGDAGDLAQDQQRLLHWLDQVLSQDTKEIRTVRDYTAVLWLPSDLDDESFTNLITGDGKQGELCLRHDDPVGLATWLWGEQNGSEGLAEIPVITLEEVDRDDAGRLRAALHCGFRAVVDGVIQPPAEAWTFQGEMLVEQISKLGVNRAILAVHDLNTGASKDSREARFQLEQKLGAVARDVERAIKATGRTNLNLFWTALLVQKAEQLPWVKYPAPSRFEQWCLLPFAPAPREAGVQVIRPKPVEADVFRTYLRDWVNADLGASSREAA